MKIAVAGSGYVGLVAGTCFAETGHDVVLVDVDEDKIRVLGRGETPFYEPGLSDLLERNVREGRLAFTTDLAVAVEDAQVVFICVGTPQSRDGSADLRHVLDVAADIGRAMKGPLVVVCKSTVPVGTAERVREAVAAHTSHPVQVVSNPEFLKEGAAVDDFLRPDRVVIGTDDEQARRLMKDLYEPFVRTGNPILFMDNASAEMTKYCANGLLAARISFMNEIARLCREVGADVNQVRIGAGADRRIGHAFLFPGVGYGGSCFPKDVRALVKTGREHGIEMEMLRATDAVNERQKKIIGEYVIRRFGEDLSGRTFAIWGLAFKPRTDDVREAPALVIIEDLLEAGAAIRAYDPEAVDNTRLVFGERIEYVSKSYDACEGADALIVATEWNEFRRPDFERIKKLLKQPVIFDGRNVYEPDRMAALGFEYQGVGRGNRG
ncbi:MAG: UDP-glucose/GDP-mannose dehydrogenase family protein [Deltaproteobacteria bacterium]|nr:UDP-glucose/GDP-mannose dehydrogenase family protein [Deltaproteobacteria bacterium]